MAETYQFGMALVEAAQAQKHVTVNAALARLDALAQIRIVSDAVVMPPAAAPDGAAYIVPLSATGVWAGQTDKIAIWANGGWVFVTPKAGWRAWSEAANETLSFDGQGWIAGDAAVGPGGSATAARVFVVDHALSAGAVSTAAGAIPGGTVVLDVSGRVISEVTGSASGWRLGVAGSDNRYGSGLGMAQNSFAAGLTGQPQTYYSAEDLILTAEGGAFAGGTVRLAVHGWQILPPRGV